MKINKHIEILFVLGLISACATNTPSTEDLTKIPNSVSSLQSPAEIHSSNIPINSSIPSQSQSPDVAPTIIPSTSDVIPLSSFSGKVYDLNGKIVENSIISAKSIDPNVSWVGESQKTVDGSYIFKNVPVDTKIQITATKENWTTRVRTEVIRTQLANIFNFGGSDNGDKIYAIQDEPEVISLKVNGKQVISSVASDKLINDKGGIPSVSKYIFSELKNISDFIDFDFLDTKYQPSLTEVDSNKLEVEMKFSEPVLHSHVENYFKIQSQYFEDNKNLILNKNVEGVSFSWSEDSKTCTFRYNRPLITNSEDQEARYIIDFTYPFQDISYKFAIPKKYFRFSDTQTNDFAVFSVKNIPSNKSNDISNLASFSGNVYDINGKPVEGVFISVKSIDPNMLWTAKSQRTKSDGSYKFNNAPVGVRLQITVTKDGWTTRSRSEVLKTNIPDPLGLIFDFGSIKGSSDGARNNIYALQDEPEIPRLKVNGTYILSAVGWSKTTYVYDKDGLLPYVPKYTFLGFNGSILLNDMYKPVLTGVDGNKLEIEMTFSEPVVHSDVEKYFRVSSQTFKDHDALKLDSNSQDVSFSWSADDKTCTFKYDKPLITNKEGNEARYVIEFESPFHDKTNKEPVQQRSFRFGGEASNADFGVFSVKNSN